MENLEGVIVFYVNFVKEEQVNRLEYLKSVRELNQIWIDRIEQEGRYAVMMVPTVAEASRVEKIDFNAPFPRFVPKQMVRTADLKNSDTDIDEE